MKLEPKLSALVSDVLSSIGSVGTGEEKIQNWIHKGQVLQGKFHSTLERRASRVESACKLMII